MTKYYQRVYVAKWINLIINKAALCEIQAKITVLKYCIWNFQCK